MREFPAVTRFAIVFTGRPLSKNHGCCPDAAGFNAPKSWAGVFHVAKYEKKGAFLAAHPSRHREYNRSGHAAAEIVEVNTFYQGILRLVKAASLLQRPFDDKKDVLVTKHLSGRPFCQAVRAINGGYRALGYNYRQNGTILDLISYDA